MLPFNGLYALTLPSGGSRIAPRIATPGMWALPAPPPPPTPQAGYKGVLPDLPTQLVAQRSVPLPTPAPQYEP